MKQAVIHQLKQHPQFGTLAMLAPIHGVLLDPESLAGKALFLVHVGLFLLWQPLISTERKLNWRETAAGLFVAGLLAWEMNWWLLASWLAILLALFGGRLLLERGGNLFRATVLVYLLGELLLWIGPHMAGANVPVPLGLLLIYLFPIGMFLSSCIGGREPKEQERSLDFFYSLLLFLLLEFILLGSVAFSLAWQKDYYFCLMQTTLLGGLAILGLSWLWRPHAGFHGVSLLFSSYLINLGTPLETWLGKLASLARSETSPDAFLQSACEALMQLEWLSGCRWNTPEHEGSLGIISRHSADYSFPPLTLTLYSKGSLSPTLLLHGKLLAQVLSEYYLAKRREQMLRLHTYNQAIHETGARLTHDIKNMLQTLQTLCAIAKNSDQEDPQALTELIQRQLPQITLRLEETLTKLQAPIQSAVEYAPANLWFAQLQRRFSNLQIDFNVSKMRDIDTVPIDAFDSIVDNLLQNAMEKRNREPGILIGVNLFWRNGICLEIYDSGSPVALDAVRNLLAMPVKSSTGLGVGLYQAAQLAGHVGYKLSLDENHPGSVRFSISRRTE